MAYLYWAYRDELWVDVVHKTILKPEKSITFSVYVTESFPYEIANNSNFFSFYIA